MNDAIAISGNVPLESFGKGLEYARLQRPPHS